MANVILIVVLILALCLVGVVLLQRSEGGGLGMGGGGGGLASSRGSTTGLAKLTWLFGAAFMAATLALTVLSAQNASNRSVIDQLGIDAPGSGGTTGQSSETPSGEDLLPPSSGGADDPLVPPTAD